MATSKVIQYGEFVHVVPAISPVDITTTTTYTDVIGVKEYSWIRFLISFGAITGDTVVVKVYECDDTTPTNSAAIAASYRLSSATGTDSMGAITTLAAAGLTITATDDNKVLCIDVNPASLSAGYPYLRVELDPGASMSACLVSAVALLTPRYPQNAQLSAVD